MSAIERDREQYLRDHGYRIVGGQCDVPELGVCWYIEPEGLLPGRSAWVSVRDWHVYWHGDESQTWQQFCEWLTASPAPPKLIPQRRFQWAE